MDWCIVFGFDPEYLSAVDQAVLEQPGLVRTTVDPIRVARWRTREAVVAWLDSVGLTAGPVPTIGIGTGELVPIPWADPLPGLHPFGVQFEMRSRAAIDPEYRNDVNSDIPPKTGRAFVRSEPFPIVVSAPPGSKLVTRESGQVGLVTSTEPFTDQCPEIAVWLARQGRRGLAIARQG